MRNTMIVPGRDKLRIDRLHRRRLLPDQAFNGQADWTSDFTFGVTRGYEIKNGKLARTSRDHHLGVAFDL
jgi:TldD protein